MAVTGVAGPTEQDGQPVGTVFFGLALPGQDAGGRSTPAARRPAADPPVRGDLAAQPRPPPPARPARDGERSERAASRARRDRAGLRGRPAAGGRARRGGGGGGAGPVEARRAALGAARTRWHLTLRFLGPCRDAGAGRRRSGGGGARIGRLLVPASAGPAPSRTGRARVVWMAPPSAARRPGGVWPAAVAAARLRPLGYEPDRQASPSPPDAGPASRCRTTSARSWRHRPGAGRGRPSPSGEVRCSTRANCRRRARRTGRWSGFRSGMLATNGPFEITVVDRRGIPRLSSVSHPQVSLRRCTPWRLPPVDDRRHNPGGIRWSATRPSRWHSARSRSSSARARS